MLAVLHLCEDEALLGVCTCDCVPWCLTLCTALAYHSCVHARVAAALAAFPRTLSTPFCTSVCGWLPLWVYGSGSELFQPPSVRPFVDVCSFGCTAAALKSFNTLLYVRLRLCAALGVRQQS